MLRSENKTVIFTSASVSQSSSHASGTAALFLLMPQSGVLGWKAVDVMRLIGVLFLPDNVDQWDHRVCGLVIFWASECSVSMVDQRNDVCVTKK